MEPHFQIERQFHLMVGAARIDEGSTSLSTKQLQQKDEMTAKDNKVTTKESNVTPTDEKLMQKEKITQKEDKLTSKDDQVIPKTDNLQTDSEQTVISPMTKPKPDESENSNASVESKLEEINVIKQVTSNIETNLNERKTSETLCNTGGKTYSSNVQTKMQSEESILETTQEPSCTSDETRGRENEAETNIETLVSSEDISNSKTNEEGQSSSSNVSDVAVTDNDFTNIKDKRNIISDNYETTLPIKTSDTISANEANNSCNTNTLKKAVKSSEDGFEKMETEDIPDATHMEIEDCNKNTQSDKGNRMCDDNINEKEIDNSHKFNNISASDNISVASSIVLPTICNNSDTVAKGNGPGGSLSLGVTAIETSCTSDTDLMGLYYSDTGTKSDSTKDRSDASTSDLLEAPRNPNIIKLYIRKVCREIIDDIVINVCEQEANVHKETNEQEPSIINSVSKETGKETNIVKDAERSVVKSQLCDVIGIMDERKLSKDSDENKELDTTVEENKYHMNDERNNPDKQNKAKSNLKEKNVLILDSETFKEKELRQIVLPKSNEEDMSTSVTETKTSSSATETNTNSEELVGNSEDPEDEDDGFTDMPIDDGNTNPDSENPRGQENRPVQIIDLWNKITGGTNTTNEELLGLITQKLIEECSKTTSSTSVTTVSSQGGEQSSTILHEPVVAEKSDKAPEMKDDNAKPDPKTSPDKDKEMGKCQQTPEKSTCLERNNAIGNPVSQTNSEKVKVQQSQEKLTCPETNTMKKLESLENSRNLQVDIVSITEDKDKRIMAEQKLGTVKKSISDQGMVKKSISDQAKPESTEDKSNNKDNNLAPSKIRNERQTSKEQPIVIDLEEQGPSSREQLQNQNIRRGEITPVKQVPPGSAALNQTPPQGSLQSPSPRRGRGRPRKIIPTASPGSTPNKKNFIENLIATGIPIIIPDDDDKVPQERSAEFKMKGRKPIMSNRQSHLMSPSRSRDFPGFGRGSPSPPIKPRLIAPKPLSSPQSLKSVQFQGLSTPPKRKSHEMQQSNQPQPSSGIINVTPNQSTRQLVGQMNRPKHHDGQGLQQQQQRIGQSPHHQQLFIQSAQHSVQPQFVGQGLQQQFVRQSPHQQIVAQSPQAQFVTQSPHIQPAHSPQGSGSGQYRLIAPSPTSHASVKRNISGTCVVIDDDTPIEVASNQTRPRPNITEAPIPTSTSMQVSNTPPASSLKNPSTETLPIITNVKSMAGQVTGSSNATEGMKSEPVKTVIENINIKKEPDDSLISSNEPVTKNVEPVKGTPKREHSIDKSNQIDPEENGPPLKRVKKEPGSEELNKSSDTNISTTNTTTIESGSYQEMKFEDERESTLKDKRSLAKGGKKASIETLRESPALESKEVITSPSKQKPQLELDIDLDDAESFRSGLSVEQVLQRMPSSQETSVGDGVKQSAVRRNLSRDVSDSEDPTNIHKSSQINIKQESEESSSEGANLPIGDLSKKVFGCGDCGKTFSTKQSLAQHFKIHTREQPFECDVCGKHFSMKTSLKKHIYTHFKAKK